MPDALKRKPNLTSPLRDYFEAYLALQSSRQSGYGAEQPISFLEIDRYADRMGFNEDFKFFYYVIQNMDKVSREFSEKRRKQQAASKPSKK